MQKSNKHRIISAEELATYSVCAEAWRLNSLEKGKKQNIETPANQGQRTAQSKELRQQWLSSQDLSARLKYYAKIAYVLLVLLVIVVFMLDRKLMGSSDQKQNESLKQEISN